MKRIITAGLAGLLLSATSSPSPAWLAQQTGYVGPGDLAPFTAWYGFRAYSHAVAVNGTSLMGQVRDPDTAEVCDVLIASTGGPGNMTNCTGSSNGVSLLTFCNSGTASCSWAKAYDQVAGNGCGGSSCNIVQATTGSQPTCTTPFTCATFGGTTPTLVSANTFTPSAAKLSFVGVAKRTVSIQTTKVMGGVGLNNTMGGSSIVTGKMVLTGGGSGSITGNATESTYIASVGVMDGASSVLRTLGAEVTGTVTASTSAGSPIWSGGTGTTNAIHEAGFINNYAFSSTERAILETNMRNYWGI